MSTTFFPGAGLDSAYPEDLIISSPDSVFFCCHSARLLSASQNGFAGYLAAGLERSIKTSELGPVISFPDHSDVLNVLLHALYSMPCSHYSPSNETVRQTLAAMVRYQVPLEAYVNPSSPIFSLFLANAAYSPLEPYAIAASFGLDELASSISVHLVSASLCSINDALAHEIGPVYLKRLFFLHLGRTEALKRLLITPPSTHESLPECNPADQRRVTKAWTLAAAYLSWDARPGMILLPVSYSSFTHSIAHGIPRKICP